MIEYKVRVYSDGYKEWYLNGNLHRTDGPAIEYSNGEKYWYLNGKLHREDGPAIEWSNGDKEWFLNGFKVTEDKVMKKHIITIDGKEIKLSEESFNELKKQLR